MYQHFSCTDVIFHAHSGKMKQFHTQTSQMSAKKLIRKGTLGRFLGHLQYMSLVHRATYSGKSSLIDL